MRKFMIVLCFFILGCDPGKEKATGSSKKASIAVASNFTATIKKLMAEFESTTDYKITASYGSTGTLYNQILNGAPFDAFFAADEKRPKDLEDKKLIIPRSRYTYAKGILALWCPKKTIPENLSSFFNEDFKYIAIANPKTAPYGAASVETLKKLEIYEKLKSKIVEGNNVSQALQFISTGNADVGFVAYSQLKALKKVKQENYKVIPQDLYRPIQQQMAILKKGADNEALLEFLKFIKSKKCRKIIRTNGYECACEFH